MVLQDIVATQVIVGIRDIRDGPDSQAIVDIRVIVGTQALQDIRVGLDIRG